MRQVCRKAGVTINEAVVKLRLMGNPEKTERLILDWFSISFSYVMNQFCFVFSIFLNGGCNLVQLGKAYTRTFAILSIL